MGHEYSLRFTSPDAEAVTVVLRQMPGAQEVFEPSHGFNFEPCDAQNGSPEATVSLEDGGTTMNAHDAFLRNLNLIVNTADIPQLPLILNRAVLDFNDLYHYLNKGMGVEPI